MTPLRESYILQQNEQNFQSISLKLTLYSQNKILNGGKMNESRFNRQYDIKFNYQEQQAVKEIFRLMEAKYFENAPLNEGVNIDTVKRVFKIIKERTVKSVSEFLKSLLELISVATAKIGGALRSFISSLTSFEGLEGYKFPSSSATKGLSEKELQFLGAVSSYVYENYKNPKLPNLLQDNVNEGFVNSVDNWISKNIIDKAWLNNPVSRLIMGEKKDGTKYNIWLSILISIVGSLIICSMIPMLAATLGASASVVSGITWACVAIWKARGVCKVLFHAVRSKKSPKENAIFKVSTIVQIALVLGGPYIMKEIGVTDMISNMIKWVVEKVGLDDWLLRICENMGWGHNATPNPDELPEISEVSDPQEFQNAVDTSVTHTTPEIQDDRGLYREMMGQGKSLSDYASSVTSDTGMDDESAKNLSDFMTKFDNTPIDGNVYDNIDHKLDGVHDIQLYFDSTGFKNAFNGREGFVPYLVKRLAEEGVNIDNATYYNLVNHDSWVETGTQQGAVDCVSLNGVENTPENQEILDKVIKEISDKSAEFGAKNSHLGILNTLPEAPEVVPEFVPEPPAGVLYMPVNTSPKPKDEESPTPPPPPTKGGRPIRRVPQLPEMVLHDVEKNVDYALDKILIDVPFSACADIMPMTDVNNMLNVEVKTIKEKAAEIRESKRHQRYMKTLGLTNNWNFLNEEDETSSSSNEDVDKKNEEVIRRESNLISFISQGKFTVTAFTFKDKKRYGDKPAIIFCPYYSMVGISKAVTGNERHNIFPYKNLFQHYTIRTVKEKQPQLRSLLTTLMYDSVLKTYEVIKFTGDKWDLVKIQKGQMYPTDHSPKGEIKMLGFLTTKEFCAVHNNAIDPYLLYSGPMNVNQTYALTRDDETDFDFDAFDGKQVKKQDVPEGQARNIDVPKDDDGAPRFNPWDDADNNHHNKTEHSQGTFDYYEQPGQKGGQGGNSNINNRYGKQKPPQSSSALRQKKQNPNMWRRFFNWFTGKKNEGFDFDYNFALYEQKQ